MFGTRFTKSKSIRPNKLKKKFVLSIAVKKTTNEYSKKSYIDNNTFLKNLLLL